MINLITLRRKIATLFAINCAMLCTVTFAQEANETTGPTPLHVDTPAVSVVESTDNLELPGQLLDSNNLTPLEQTNRDVDDEEILPAMPEDMDVLTRGPLHEAFATAHQSNPDSSPFVANRPPELIEEVPPEYKPEGKNVQWVPGYWAWDDGQDDFIWVSGVWRDVPPQRRWVPGYWDESDGGFRWISGFWAEETQEELGYLPEPPASIDQGPSTVAPSENHFYVPGNWEYRNNQYRWLSGHWQPVVENWIWIPARYIWTPSGCVYQSGYWDYEFDRRGTCFAPVYFKRPVYLATSYYYRPSFAINLNIDFLTHVFVRPRCGHYYYGDWYSANFLNFGYRPWVYYRSHYRSYDPLLTYYRCRRSVFDNRFNTVQYLARQHHFYSNHFEYRPRPTFVAQFNFINSINNQARFRNLDYLRKSNYVRTYSNVLKTAQRDAQRRGRELQIQNNRLQRELQRQRVQYQRVQQDELRNNQRRIDQLARLQTERKKNEVRLASNHSRATTNRHRSLKLPPNLTNRQIKQIRREFPTAKKGANGKQLKIEKDRSSELKKAIETARRQAAQQQRTQREQDRKIQNELAKNQRAQQRRQQEQQQVRQQRARDLAARDFEKANRSNNADAKRRAEQLETTREQLRRQQLSQLANQRSKNLNQSRDERLNREPQRRSGNSQRKIQQEIEASKRERKRQNQQNAKQAQKQLNEARNRTSAENRRRELEQRKRQQDATQKARQRQQQQQARRSRQESQRNLQQRLTEQTRQAQADQARVARQQKAQQDAARRAQKNAQRDAARLAQQRKAQLESARRLQQQQAKQQQAQQQRAQLQRQRDAARKVQQQQRAQQQRQRDAARRAQQQRNRTKSNPSQRSNNKNKKGR